MASQILVQRVAREEIARKIRDQKAGIVLYNPDSEWREIKALGGVVLFPPDLGGKLIPHLRKVDPVTRQPVNIMANGRVEVHDRYGYKKDNRGRRTLVALEGRDGAGDRAAHHREASRDRLPDGQQERGCQVDQAGARELPRVSHDGGAEAVEDAHGLPGPVAPGQPRPGSDAADGAAAAGEEVHRRERNGAGLEGVSVPHLLPVRLGRVEPYQQHMKSRHNMEVNDPRVGGKKPELDLVGREVDAVEEPGA